MPIIHAFCRAKMNKAYCAAEFRSADTAGESTCFLLKSTLRPMPKGPITADTSVWEFIECFELPISTSFIQLNA